MRFIYLLTIIFTCILSTQPAGNLELYLSKVPADTVYIVVTDSSEVPENDYYIVEPVKEKKKKNWLKNIFKPKRND